MKYLLAVSGGIDSMTLLDLAATNQDNFFQTNFPDARWPADVVVAHFNHGIRGEASVRDADFVKKRCSDYGVNCLVGHGHLPDRASEATARQARYSFFADVIKTKLSGLREAILVTAHHQDDLVETAVMNLVRGTGWRGLAPMVSAQPLRPLLNWTKVGIITYAIEHNLTWVEDQTNYSTYYFRNRLRDRLISCPGSARRSLLCLIHQQQSLRRQIQIEVTNYCRKYVTPKPNQRYLARYELIMLPDSVALEVLRSVTMTRLTRPQLCQLLWFAKTAKSGKKIHWRDISVNVDQRTVCITGQMPANYGVVC